MGMTGINDAGEIIGSGVFPNEPQKEEAFLWRKDVVTDLGNLGDCYGVAHAINSQSQVVGLAFSSQPGFPGFPCDGNDARAFLLGENASAAEHSVGWRKTL
jgi:probable HAF family extracellular repeat protein